jgi:hypothetical protein
LFEAETEDSQKPESEENRRQRHHAFINASLAALVEIARRSFHEEGRGSIVVIPKMPGREKGGLMFVKQSDLQAAGKNAQEVRLVEQYDPHTEFVIAIVGEPGSAPPGVSSYRIKMPEAHSAQRGSEPAEHLEP